mgnify:CR=1 FL=1
MNGIYYFTQITMYAELLIRAVSRMPSADRLSAHKIVTANQVRFLLSIDYVQSAPKCIEWIPIV